MFERFHQYVVRDTIHFPSSRISKKKKRKKEKEKEEIWKLNQPCSVLNFIGSTCLFSHFRHPRLMWGIQTIAARASLFTNRSISAAN